MVLTEGRGLGINDYIDFYNIERPHQSLGDKTPAEVYYGRNN